MRRWILFMLATYPLLRRGVSVGCAEFVKELSARGVVVLHNDPADARMITNSISLDFATCYGAGA
jgi:hypothetical protein